MDQNIQDRMSEIDKDASAMQRDLERDHIRKMQGRAFICGSKCCDNTSASAEQVQRCIEQCQKPLMETQALVKQELERFQNRIQRCMMSCQDSAQDSLSSKGEAATKSLFNSCLLQCADEHLKLIPSIKKRLVESLPQNS